MKTNFRSSALVLASALICGAASAEDGLRTVVGGALTGGGKTLVTVSYTDGHKEDVKSGGLLNMFVGVEKQTGPFTLQATVGYHVDDSSGSNGSVKFARFPFEVLGFGQLTEKVRLGGGVRKSTGAKVSSSGVASSLGSTKFDGRPGFVVQADYFLEGEKFSVYSRYVAEKYEVGGTSVSGNHVGVGISYRF